jgi:hypothetical protein
VLVAPAWVITAAHVATGRTPAQLTVRLGARSHAVRCVVVHPAFAAARPGLARSAHDVALLALVEPSMTTPMPLAERPPDLGARVTLVGYGVGGPGARDTAGTRRGAQNRLDQRGGQWRGTALPPSLLLLDFDDGEAGTANPLGSATPEPLEGIASGGDSGGGLFVPQDGRWALAGTFSLSAVDVGAAARGAFGGTVNIYAGTSGYAAWLVPILRAADGQAGAASAACPS